MKKKFLNLILMLFMPFTLIGCVKTMKITDFDVFRNLPKNPSRIAFGTNSMSFIEEEGIYGELIEHEIQYETIEEIMEELFTVTYEGLQKNIKIDLHPIVRYLVIYDNHENNWKVELGLRHYKNRWYSPVNDYGLINLLYIAIST